MYLCVLCGSENKRRLFLYTTLAYRFYNRSSVYCAVRIGSLNQVDKVSYLKGFIFQNFLLCICVCVCFTYFTLVKAACFMFVSFTYFFIVGLVCCVAGNVAAMLMFKVNRRNM